MGTVTLMVERTGGSTGAVSVDWATADDSAVAGSDYTTDSGTITWTDGDSTSKQIVISVLNDLIPESDEAFTVVCQIRAERHLAASPQRP